MSLHMRSTNERVLARHHIRRSPAIVGYPPVARGFIDDDSDDGDDVNDEEDGDEPITRHQPVMVFPSSVRLLPPAVISSPPTTINKPVITSSVRPLSSIVHVSAPLSTASPPPSPSLSPSPSSPPLPPPPPSSSPSTSHTSTPHTRTSQSVLESSNVILTAPTATSESSDGTSTKVQGSSGVSSKAVGGIVAAVILITLALLAFFIRKVYLRRRAKKRNTWGAGLVPALENKRDTIYGGQPYMGQPINPNNNVVAHKRLPNVPMMDEMTQTAGHQPLGFQHAPALSPPPPSFGPTSPYPSSFGSTIHPSSIKSMPPGSPVLSSSVSEIATVARTFIPSLPDELHIANGEQIRVLNAYDDGWALCANMRGEQGVVPIECLERNNTPEMQLQPHNEFGVESSRASKRMSSLTPNVGETY